MTTTLNDPVLAAAEQKIEASLTPENRVNYQKIVVAGMKVAMDGGPNSIIASLQKSKDPLGDCVKGALGLCVMMQKHSRGTMPVKAMIPAATTLMLHALDFADRTGLIKVGSPELVKATKMLGDLILQKSGISQQMLQTAGAKVHAITQDPAQLAKVKQAAAVGGGTA